MAITTKGVLDWILYEKAGSDHCRLIDFIKQFIEGKKNKLILMDNASCHRNENVKEFIKYRDEHFANTGYFCRVTLQLTFMQNNMHELADIVKLAASLGVDRVKGHQLWAHFEEIKDLSMKVSKDSIAQWNEYVKQALEAQEKYRKPNGEKVLLENIIPLTENENTEVPEHYECPFLTKELWISATGKVSPCCAPDNLRKALGDFGNIENTSIQEVLNSTVYTELVKKYKSIPLCKSCNMRKPSNNN